MYAALRATLHQQPGHFLNKQRHAACALVNPLDQLFGQCMAGRVSPTMRATPARSNGDREIKLW